MPTYYGPQTTQQQTPVAAPAAKIPAPPAASNTAPAGTFASLLSGVGNTNNTPSGTLTGITGTGGFLGDVYGRIPGVANPTGTASNATKGDIGNLTQIANLTQGADTLSAAGAQLPFNVNLPGYQQNLSTQSGNVASELGGNIPGAADSPALNSLIGRNSASELSGNIPGLPGFGQAEQTATGNTQAELEGKLPQDVVTQLTQQAAERGVAGGQDSTSPNVNSALLRALGLTSLDQQGKGISDLSNLETGALAPLGAGATAAGEYQNNALTPINAGNAAFSGQIGATPTGTPFNPATQFVTPEQQQAAAQAAQNAAAAPDPGTSGLLSTIFSFL